MMSRRKPKRKVSGDELTATLQPLVEERLRLQFHYDSKELPFIRWWFRRGEKLVEAEGERGPPP
jgi:hypothetical protein